MPRRMTSAELIGREHEVRRFEAALRGAAAHEPSHLLIGGEAGVGKTRLLAAFAERAGAADARVVGGGCVSMGDTGLPFAPFTEILRSLIAQDGATEVAALAGRARDDLARLVPALSSGSSAPDQELWAQTRMYEAVLDLFRRYAEKAPLVVQLEDLHWADAGTLAATSFLLRNVTDEAIVVLATYREDEVVRAHPLRAWLAEAVRFDGVERIALRRLDSDEVGELAANITGEQPDVELIRDLQRRSDGNPFFVEELIASRQEGGHDHLPETIRDVLLSRVYAASEPARRLIGVAAVGGRTVGHDLLMTVGGNGADSNASLRELVEAGLLQPTPGPGAGGYTFRHALLQEAVHDALLPHERRDLHRAFGEVLAAESAPAEGDTARLVELAYHWRQANDARALEASIRAGEAAMASFSFDVAAREYRHALELWDRGSMGEERHGLDHVALLGRLARAAHLASEFTHAEAAARAAIDELGEDGDPERRTDLTVELGRVLWIAGHYRDSLETYERAYREAPDAPSFARTRSLSGLAQIYMLFGRYVRAGELATLAVEMTREQGLRELEGHALNTLGTSLTASGRGDEGLAALDEALAIANELNLPDDIGRAYVNRGDILDYLVRPDEALATTMEGIERISDLGMEASYGSYLRQGAVRFAFEIGDWPLAAELLVESDRRSPAGPGPRLYRALYALPFLVASGSDEALEVWQEAHGILLESPPSADSASAFKAAIELAALEDRLDDAVALVREGLDYEGPADPGRFLTEFAVTAAWPVAELGLRDGRSDDPQVRARVGADAARDLDDIAAAVEAARNALHGSDEKLSDLLDLAARQIEAERQRLEGEMSAKTWVGLARGWAELRLPYASLYPRMRAAEAAAATGERDVAASTLREAHATAEELGARPMLALLERLARRLRIRLDAGASKATIEEADDEAAAYGLTPRELEVLALVATGRTNRQIAEQLFISESTAGVHVSNLMGKLGVSTRTEAASLALSQGLVEA